MPEETLPDYEPMLAAYHRAFADELREMVDSLPIAEGDRVLDLACGDGAYTPWLAERVGRSGSVVALDLLASYLQKARVEVRGGGGASRSRFVAGSVDRLPFADGSFDLAWCAQSLFSLPDPVRTVHQMARVIRPGGVVAVLEDDTLHQVLLPWPVDLELAIRKAEWDAYREESSHPRKFYIGRRLVPVFQRAGLVEIQLRTRASNRMAPLDGPERTFLVEYLKSLRERVENRLGPSDREEFDRRTGPGSRDYLPDQADLAMTVIDHLIWGRLPCDQTA